MHVTRGSVTAAVVVAVLAVLVPAPSSGRAADRVVVTTPTEGDRSLAGHQWHYRAQVDGRGAKDRVTITALPGFAVNDFGMGLGQVKVSVRLAGTRRTAEVWEYLSYVSVRTPWTPWLGATDLDHRRGKELLIGFTTGAHTQGFFAFTYQHHQLLELQQPRGGEWIVNSSFGTGTSGWRCTPRGVQSRAVSPASGGMVTLTRKSYVWRTSGWRRVSRVTQRVPTDAQGNPPAATAAYARFACPGLPRTVL